MMQPGQGVNTEQVSPTTIFVPTKFRVTLCNQVYTYSFSCIAVSDVTLLSEIV
jgi:hypothetical protein